MELELTHPNSPELIVSRDDLLQKTMRPIPALFPISKEYPIVLDSNLNRYSFCLSKGHKVIAHANLWPRAVINSSGSRVTSVGLVGNVATDPNYQGQGIMSRLMNQLQQRAVEDGLSHLILWSDLDSFYQKRGFASLGREIRLFFAGQALAPFFELPRFVVLDPTTCLDNDLRELLDKRPKVTCTLQRSLEEFRRQLQIPGTSLIYDADKRQSFAILGKGYDMGGIVHEWSAQSPEDLLSLLAWSCEKFQLSEIGILIPGELSSQWASGPLDEVKLRREEWPMALCKPIGAGNSSKTQALAQLFVWGLDAI